MQLTIDSARLGVDPLLDRVSVQKHALGFGEGGRECVGLLVGRHEIIHRGHQLEFHILRDRQGRLQKFALRMNRVIGHVELQ